MTTPPTERVTATPAARDAISALRAARGPVVFVQSGGCCGGSVLDVEDGEPEGLSLPAGPHLHFVTHVRLERSAS